jgi:hypothetical protein
MIAFHSRQSDCVRCARKDEYACTFNFASQVASSICTVAFTKCEKFDATIFTSRCSRLSLIYIFIHGQALPLSFVRFLQLANRSPKNARSAARRSRNVREPSAKKSGEVSRSIPHNFQTIADNGQCNAATLPRKQLARQLAIWRAAIRQHQLHNPRNRNCHIPRIILHDDPSKFWHHIFNHKAHQL